MCADDLKFVDSKCESFLLIPALHSGPERLILQAREVRTRMCAQRRPVCHRACFTNSICLSFDMRQSQKARRRSTRPHLISDAEGKIFLYRRYLHRQSWHGQPIETPRPWVCGTCCSPLRKVFVVVTPPRPDVGRYNFFFNATQPQTGPTASSDRKGVCLGRFR